MVKINKLISETALCAVLSCHAAMAEDINTNIAQMQAMDKITGKVSVIEAPVNGEVNFGSFSIVVRSCKTKPAEETPENKAFVDVVDNYNSEKPVNIFRGWMFSSSPAVNAVEHPIYDVWLLKCIQGKPKGKLLTAEELAAREEIEMLRPEKELPKEDKEGKAEETPKAEANQETENDQSAPEQPMTESKPQENPETLPAELPAPLDASDAGQADADGGPQSLINLQQNDPQEDAARNEDASNAENEETPEETAVDAEEIVKIEPLTAVVNEENVSEDVPSEQLIDLSSEIQEDEFELNADALLND